MDINGLAINTSVFGSFMQQPQQTAELMQQSPNEGDQGEAKQAMNTVQGLENGDQAAAQQGKGLNLNLKV